MKTTTTGWINVDRKYIDFGTQDKQGRNIGSRICTFEADFVEVHETAHMWYNMPAAGHYYGLNAMAARNGARFGAAQSDQYFTDATNRQAALDTYLVGAKKRAAKKAS